MLIFGLFLLTTSLQVGVLLCNDHAGVPKNVDIYDVLDRVEQLEKRDNDRETELRLWKQQMDAMKSQMAVVLDENGQLKQEIGKLNHRMTEMEGECKETGKTKNTKKHENDEKSIKKNMKYDSKILKIFGGYKTSVGERKERSLKDNVEHNTGEAASVVNRIQRFENELGVAFYAGLTNHFQHGVNQIVVFDTIYTNVGNAYNVHAGDFRAPVAGTYVFSTTLLAYVPHSIHFYFAKNGTNVGRIFVDAQSSSSMAIILRLNAGEDVSVRNVDPDETLHGIQYSSFSGFLLQQDFSVSAGNVFG